MESDGKFKGLKWGILPKLLVLFLILSTIPLTIVGYIANSNLHDTGIQAVTQAEEMGHTTLKEAEDLGKTAIEDSMKALVDKSTEAIELRTVELAQRVADFLYERDKDILFLASMEPDAGKYLDVYRASKKDVIVPDPPSLKSKRKMLKERSCSNPENRESWRHRPQYLFNRVSKPLYREITFIDLEGHERIKVSNGGISDHLYDVSEKRNTFCKAEGYFSRLKSLNKGDIYVSRVVGAQVKGWLYKTPEGIKVKPESAYAGKENPHGRKYEGIIRWAAPVYNGGDEKIGYVTAALDHIHLMEFAEHVVPSEDRFSDMSDAASGNYAFIWDDRDRSIVHPRHFFICGYDPETGEEVPGWISQATYDEYKGGGLSLGEFVKRLPSFRSFSQKKAGSLEQTKTGNISLDCRVLDTAPQCQGWHEGTEDGGSGSFLILWSGLWKLTTYATIPYYTGDYRKSKRGFGYVTIGANVNEFYKAANITKAKIENSIFQVGQDIISANMKTRDLIKENSSRNRNQMTAMTIIAALSVICASVFMSLKITRPVRRMNEGAVAMSRGELSQFIEVKSNDEIGQLAKSFNEMAKAVSEVDKMKSEFVTIASHELRTPIQAMLLGVSGILDGYSGKIDEEVREDLQLAKVGIERLMRLVTNLLDLSRIEARKIELSIEKTSFVEILNRAVDEVSDLIEVHRHQMVVNVYDGIPYVEADRDRMIQVVVNVLSNSIKYTPDEGKIIIDVERENGNVKLSVADNGYGVPPWAKEEIFKKFYQADAIMSQKVGGSGLGLTITKGIIEEHGGTIACESPIPEGRYNEFLLGGERKGAIFTIRLPIHHSAKR